MEDKTRLLCRIGLHKWGAWESVNIPLKPMFLSVLGREISELRVEIKIRECGCCHAEQTRKVLFW